MGSLFAPYRQLSPQIRFAGRAAEYVRMSKEDQRYSIANQRDAILTYAINHRLTVVRTYADSGKSGLRIAGRTGLMQLIDDIQRGAVDFSTVLVYDVSRWGRFQDTDEGAYYEHLYRRTGIALEYCAEMFQNDGGITATLIKSIKRAMAAEYSRELSVKIFLGKCRLAKLGVRQGGCAGYGLRRQLIDANGKPKTILNAREQKAIHTDRVILVPGPLAETKTVKWIFKRFVATRKPPAQIAAELAKRGFPAPPGRYWSRSVVCAILSNEKYIGNHLYNRSFQKFGAVRILNKPESWIRLDGAFKPLVGSTLFRAASRILNSRSTQRYTTEEMLRRLSDTLKRHGKLSADIIDAEPKIPCARVYQLRFGSLVEAYRLVGFAAKPVCVAIARAAQERRERRQTA